MLCGGILGLVIDRGWQPIIGGTAPGQVIIKQAEQALEVNSKWNFSVGFVSSSWADFPGFPSIIMFPLTCKLNKPFSRWLIFGHSSREV